MKNINDNELNKILKNLYETNFFENVSVIFENNILIINVKENPIIENIKFKGIKIKKIKKLFKKKFKFKIKIFL